MAVFRNLLVNGLCILLLGLSGCIEPFEPEVPVQATKALVVDGFINSNGRTTIKLSRTYDLASTAGPLTVDKAQVLIQGEGSGEEYLLREVKSGTYVSDSLILNPGTQYRLFFRTRDSRQQLLGQYASAYLPVKTSPPIEALTWKVVPRGLELYANTFDATGNSRYYRWDYTETWEFTSAGESQHVYENQQMRRRRADEQIYQCWQTVHSPTIKLTSTKRLSEDRVTEFPLLEFPAGDTRLRYKYSVLVRQYTMGAEEYAYWEALKKNTETIGSLFDPLPSQSTGNVRNLNQPQEPVLGFVGVGSVTQKRIFISKKELPGAWTFKTGYEDCGLLPVDVLPLKGVAYSEVLSETFSSGDNIPIYQYYNSEYGNIYTSYPEECADCRLRGTTTRPTFWQ
ncbi:DUF4249 domain-containing protein [Hymenobacter sp. DG25A]|uniref:DUF4249 domain-containing protein n=1 Tax=Hymenobacter sp. DG25A TaxID=1385663 RepID=UPI0006BCA713|nr:DUF4249 domain-containing protein [Hymenobacter sp. DG25A]ALD20701.1 hypothetical protein AM218_05035 [Hymenobacter sp. DG25A]